MCFDGGLASGAPLAAAIPVAHSACFECAGGISSAHRIAGFPLRVRAIAARTPVRQLRIAVFDPVGTLGYPICDSSL